MKKFLLMALLFTGANASASLPADPSTYDGDYDVEIKIGDRVFHDFLRLAGRDEPIQAFTFHGPLAGSMTLPGVFTAPIEGTGTCFVAQSFCGFEFTIHTQENGQPLVVTYSMNDFNSRDLLGARTFQGEARLEDGTVFGQLTATKVR